MRLIRLVCAATIVIALASPGSTAPFNGNTIVTDISAQRVVKKKRAQIRVTPLYPRATTNTPYPRPYDFQYPGPNAQRKCVGGLVEERRPSGTVVVPRLRCWWAPG